MHDEFQQLILEKRSRLIRLGFTIPEAAGLAEPHLNAVLRLVDEYERKIDDVRRKNLAMDGENESRNSLILAIQQALVPRITVLQTALFVANISSWAILALLVAKNL